MSDSEFQETEAVQVKKQQFGVLYDLDSLFIPGPRSSSVPTYSWGSPVASAQFLDEFSPLFGGIYSLLICLLTDTSYSTSDSFPVESEELPGESDKRRVARWEREQLIKNRMVCM